MAGRRARRYHPRVSARATVLGAVTAVFLVAFVGALARRRGWLPGGADGALMDLVVRVLYPALILDTILGNPRLADPANLLLPPLFGAATVLAGFAVAAALAHFAPLRGLLAARAERRTFALGVGLFNYSYLPIPLTQLLFDAGTLGVLFVFNVGTELVLWTAGVLLLAGGAERGAWKRAFNPPSLAVALGLALNLLGAGDALPAALRRTLVLLGQCAIPLAVLLVGATVADELRQVRWRHAAGVVAAALGLRLLLLPAAMVAVAALLPLPLELRRVLVLQAAMPAAMLPVVLAKYYGGDPATAVRIVLSTSLAALATIPLWLGFGLGLLR